jgi:hypothetical protein
MLRRAQRHARGWSPEVVRVTTMTKTIEGAEVRLDRVLALSVRGQDVQLQRAITGPVAAERDVRIKQGGSGPVAAGGDVEIHEGGCGPVFAGGSFTLSKGGCGPVFANSAVIGERGSAGIVVAGDVHLEPGATVGTHVPKSTALAALIATFVAGSFGVAIGALLARRR